MELNRRRILQGGLALAAVSTVPVLVAGCSTSWIQTAINDLPTAISIINSVASIVSLASGNQLITPTVTAAINAAADVVKTGLTTLQDAITAYQGSANTTTLAKVTDTLTQLTTVDLPALLNTFTFTDQATKVAVTTGVTLLISTLQAIQLLIPASTTTANSNVITTKAKVPSHVSAQASLKTKITLPTKDHITSLFNSTVVSTGYASAQIQ